MAFKLEPVPSDYEQLFAQNPLAAEQLKVIILRRMYGEAMARIDEPSPEGELAEESR